MVMGYLCATHGASGRRVRRCVHVYEYRKAREREWCMCVSSEKLHKEGIQHVHVHKYKEAGEEGHLWVCACVQLRQPKEREHGLHVYKRR